MRNPIDRAWSQVLMNLTRDRKYEEIHQSDFVDHFGADRFLMRGDYRTILDHWLSVFPEKQLFIGFFEDIVERP